MNIEAHGELEIDNADFLWRYMSQDRLLQFLEEKKLHFTRLDDFDDPLEGLTQKVIAHMFDYEVIKSTLSKEGQRESFYLKNEEEQIKRGDYIEKRIEYGQKTQYASCWFIGKKESIAMWKLYSKQDGVVIKYPAHQLINIAKASAKSFEDSIFTYFFYGRIIYCDVWPYPWAKKELSPVKYSAFKKDESYSHEKEFRFVTVTSDRHMGEKPHFKLPLSEINKDSFEIYCNPSMSDNDFIALQNIIKELGFENRVNQSALKFERFKR